MHRPSVHAFMNFYMALPVQGIDPPSPPGTEVANTLGLGGHSLLVATTQLYRGRRKTCRNP